MSTKFFNNIDATLLDKFHGIASAMANFDIFHAVVGYFRSSGYPIPLCCPKIAKQKVP